MSLPFKLMAFAAMYFNSLVLMAQLFILFKWPDNPYGCAAITTWEIGLIAIPILIIGHHVFNKCGRLG